MFIKTVLYSFYILLVVFSVLVNAQLSFNPNILIPKQNGLKNETNEWSIGQLQQTMIATRNELEQLKLYEAKLKIDLELLKKSHEQLRAEFDFAQKKVAELKAEKEEKQEMKNDVKRSEQNSEEVVKRPSAVKVIFINPEIEKRLNFIKEMARSAWNAYYRYAWGTDSLNPLSNTSYSTSFGRYSGRTIVASLSTLWVMGLKDEFNQGKHWIQSKFNYTEIDGYADLFKQVTEYMGGLLSSYALSGDEMFVKKANEIGLRMKNAYNTSTGIPYGSFNPKTKKSEEITTELSRFGGQHLEHVYLSDLTSNLNFKYQVTRIRNYLKSINKTNGLYFTVLSEDGQWDSITSTLSTDSREFYRNLIKSYIQSDGQDADALQMYREAIAAVEAAKMFQTSPNKEISFFGEYNDGNITDVAEYPTCYLGAMLSLGATAIKNEAVRDGNQDLHRQATKHLQMALKLTETCYQMTNQTKTKLGAYYFVPQAQQHFKAIGFYRLTSELAESYFILWRATGDVKYREYAWEMAQAINRHCRTASGGFAGVLDVNQIPVTLKNRQPPEFLSATLKYLYLTFVEKDVLPLNQWVFNSAGHPLPICGKQKTYPAKLCKK